MDIALLIIPVPSIILLGWISASLNYVSRSVSQPLVLFVLKIAAPALIFLVLSQQPLDKIFNYKFIGVFGGAAFLFFTVVTFLARIFGRPIEVASLLGLAASQSSAGFVALPILLVIFGHQAALPVAITMFILLLVMLPIGVAFIEYGKGDKGEANIPSQLQNAKFSASENCH